MVVGLAMLTLAGCYEHTISERGLGTGRQPIYEPNAPAAEPEAPAPVVPRPAWRP